MDIAQAINDAIADTKISLKAVDQPSTDRDYFDGALNVLLELAARIAREDFPGSPQLSRPELLAELKRHHHELTVEEQALEIQLEQANKAICCQQESLMDVRDQRIAMQSLIDNMMGEQQPEHEEAETLPFDCTPIHDAMTQQWKHGLKPKVLDD